MLEVYDNRSRHPNAIDSPTKLCSSTNPPPCRKYLYHFRRLLNILHGAYQTTIPQETYNFCIFEGINTRPSLAGIDFSSEQFRSSFTLQRYCTSTFTFTTTYITHSLLYILLPLHTTLPPHFFPLLYFPFTSLPNHHYGLLRPVEEEDGGKPALRVEAYPRDAGYQQIR